MDSELFTWSLSVVNVASRDKLDVVITNSASDNVTINNDSKIDNIIANYGLNSMDFLTNRGNRIFSDQLIYWVGELDIIVSNTTLGSVGILLAC